MKKTRISSLLATSVLFVGLMVGVYMVGRSQLIDNRAQGSSEVNVVLVPPSGNIVRGNPLNIDVAMKKTASRAISVSGAEANLTLSSNLVITSATCLAPFNGTQIATITGQTVAFLCTIPVNGAIQALGSANVPFARVTVNVPATAATAATISFTKTRVTEAGIPNNSPDVSSAGTNGTYTPITPSPTPTNTPIPTATPTPTNTPTPTRTPTPTPSNTPTPTPYPCPRGSLGNLDCSISACIDTGDFELFRQAFGKQVSTLVIPFNHHTPNLNKDSSPLIDTGDYGIFVNNFGSCQ